MTKWTNLQVIECDPADGDTSTLDDRFLVFTEDNEILANCVSREIADALVAALCPRRLTPAELASFDEALRHSVKVIGFLPIDGEPVPTIDDVPSCGQENDWRRAQKGGT